MKKFILANRTLCILLVFIPVIILFHSCKKKAAEADPIDDGNTNTYTGTRTVGLMVNNTSKVFDGYTFLRPNKIR